MRCSNCWQCGSLSPHGTLRFVIPFLANGAVWPWIAHWTVPLPVPLACGRQPAGRGSKEADTHRQNRSQDSKTPVDFFEKKEILRKREKIQIGVAHRDLVHSLAFSPDGNLLASGGYREVKLWRRPRDVQKFNLASIARESVLAVAVSPDAKRPRPPSPAM